MKGTLTEGSLRRALSASQAVKQAGCELLRRWVEGDFGEGKLVDLSLQRHMAALDGIVADLERLEANRPRLSSNLDPANPDAITFQTATKADSPPPADPMASFNARATAFGLHRWDDPDRSHCAFGRPDQERSSDTIRSTVISTNATGSMPAESAVPQDGQQQITPVHELVPAVNGTSSSVSETRCREQCGQSAISPSNGAGTTVEGVAESRQSTGC